MLLHPAHDLAQAAHGFFNLRIGEIWSGTEAKRIRAVVGVDAGLVEEFAEITCLR